MLTGNMPAEEFPTQTECQGAEDAYYTDHILYKVYPNVLAVDLNGSKPSTSTTQFSEAADTTQPINAGIVCNAPACRLNSVGSSLAVTNYIMARYVGRIPLSFYGPKTPKGERFKLVLTNNDLDERIFAKEEDLSENTGSRDKTTFYSGGN